MPKKPNKPVRRQGGGPIPPPMMAAPPVPARRAPAHKTAHKGKAKHKSPSRGRIPTMGGGQPGFGPGGPGMLP